MSSSLTRNPHRLKDEGPATKRARQETTSSSDPEYLSEEEEVNLTQSADFDTSNEAENGVIEHVRVKNFMCHKHLEFNFGPNVNFIVGQNGSGKSAILTAIVVGLGGKAASTNRGSSVKDLIKDTEQVAEITIKLRNRGLGAFKPNQYGPTIVVERRLKSDGTSSYKLCSKSGKVISHRYIELQQIKDHYNIQIDNPVSILNQDTSRNFLPSQDPKDKYKFFLKAAQLDEMTEEYKSIQLHKKQMEDIVHRKEETLPELEREVLQNEQRFKDLDSIQKLQKKRDSLMNMAAWSQVAAEEKVLDAMLKELKQEENRTPEFDDKIQTSQAKVEQSETHYRSLQDQLNELGEKIKELQRQHAMAKSEMDKQRKKEREITKKVGSKQNNVKSLAGDKNDLQQRIDELKNSSRRDYEDERKVREGDIQRLQEHIKAQEAQKATTEQDLTQFVSAVTRAKESTYELKTQETDFRHGIEASERRVRNLEASRKDRLKLYGDFMPNLLNEISKAAQKNMFHQKPKGPIGNHLKLKDPQWALGIEACLGLLMFKFCCHDYHDMGILNQLIACSVPEKRFRPGIIVSAFQDQKYNIQDGAVRCQEHPSLLDMLDIEDPMIYNCLVDQRAVERVLLIKSSQDARNLLRLRTPDNCREAFTLSGDQVYAGRDQRYYSNRNTKARVLQGDVEDDIRDLEQELQELKQKQRNAQGQLQELNKTIRENEQQKARAQTQRRRIQDSINQLSYDKQQLEAIKDVTQVDVSTLEEEVATLAREIDAHQESLDELGGQYIEIHKDYKKISKEYRTLDEQIKNFADQVQPIKDDVLTATTEIESSKSDLRHYNSKKTEHLDKIGEMGRRHDEKSEEVQKMVGQAQQVHAERIRTNRKPRDIDSEIDQITKRIEKEQQSKGDKEKIIRLYDQTQKRYKKIRKELTMFKKFIKKLDELLEVRKGHFLVLRQHIALRVKFFFITRLFSTLRYNGKINLQHPSEEHQSGELEITVQPTQGDGVGSQDMKALSGGERSFFTVCLIMALWESMDTPFMALDEFDVFMDMDNRRISMNLMLKVAKVKQKRQFIFLTPLDMSKIKADPLVRISRMPDPILEDQSVLPFEPAGRSDNNDDEGFI